MYPCLLSRVISDYLLIKKFQKKMTNVFSVLPDFSGPKNSVKGEIPLMWDVTYGSPQ